MGRKNEADLDVEKQERAARHTAQFGKSLGSQPGSEEERRQQALALLRKKAQAKKEGKRVVVDKSVAESAHKQAKKDGKKVVADKSVADGAHKQAKRDGKRLAVGDNGADGTHMQAPPKRAKAPRNFGVGALVIEKTSNKGDHTLAHPMRAMTPPRRTPDPVQEVVESLNQHNKEEKLAKARAKKQGKKPMIAENEGEEDEISSNDEHADPKSKFLHQTARHFVSSPQLPSVPDDFYSDFGMVGFLVQRLMHYKSWAWTNRDSGPQIGIGGWITPLIAYQGIDLGEDGISPTFLDGAYLRKAQFLSGRFKGRCVYSYSRGGNKAELLLPIPQLTSLSTTRDISFDISEEHLLRSHGPLCPVTLPKGEKAARKKSFYDQKHTRRATAHLFGPPRYKFEQCTSALPFGPIRQAHDQISTLQRWNRAQDRTIFKLTNQCKELKRTVKRQAEASARFMSKVADVLARGAVAGCKAEYFDLEAFNAPPPQPLHDPSAPKTKKHALCRLRNPYIAPSESGNQSPSLDTTADEDDSEGEASASSHAP
ncbi:hypothetical protein Bca4012_037633 [Brassica carinata]